MLHLARGIARLLDISLSVRAGEGVLIVADDTTTGYADAFAFGARERGAEVSIITMLRRTRHGEEPPVTVKAAMQSSRVAILATMYSLTHTEARRAATNAGCRILTLPGINDVIFLDGSLEVNFDELAPMVREMGRRLSAAKAAQLRSGNGLVLTLPLAGRPSVDQTGICREPGAMAVPPNIETAVSPLEETAEGAVMVDGAIAPGGLVDEPVRVEFRKGRISSIEGGRSAAAFRELLASYNDSNVYCAVELGVGMNPNARMGRGSLLEDEGEFGAVHIGLGEGRSFGSTIRAKAHLDLILRTPTLELEGEVILQDKGFRIPGYDYRLDKGGSGV